jgi:autoinducer 2-degrading protein
MLIVEATYRCKPGTRDRLLEILKANVEGTRREKGNISYAHYPSPENEVYMFVFEKWENPEVFAGHSRTPHHQAFCAARRPLLEPDSYHITFWNSEVNEELTSSALAFVKANIN